MKPFKERKQFYSQCCGEDIVSPDNNPETDYCFKCHKCPVVIVEKKAFVFVKGVDTCCERCGGLVSTGNIANAKFLKKHSLFLVNICNDCATKKDCEEAMRKCEESYKKYKYGLSPAELKLIISKMKVTK